MLGSLTLTAIWSPNWERVLGSASTPLVRLQIAVLGASIYNPGCKLVSSVCVQKYISGFTLTFTMLFVSPCESWDFLDPWGLGRPTGAQEILRPTPSLIWSAAWLAGNNWCAHGQAHNPGSARQVRGLLSCFWSLNKEERRERMRLKQYIKE